MISVTINGKPRGLAAPTRLPDLLKLFEIDVRRVAVAINGEVIPKRQHGDTVVVEGDAVEVVRMVGGGAGDSAARPAGAPRRAPHRASTGAEVVIAGAGIVGCAIAYELSRKGVSCIVLDSRRLGMAATNAAAGVLAPLAEFRRPDALMHLGLAGLRLYPEWVERLKQEVPDIDVEFTTNGVLRVALDEEEMGKLREGLRLQSELGMELVELDAAIVREVEPRLSEEVAGGVLGTQDGQVSNQMFTLAVARAAQQRDVQIMENRPVLGFRRRDGRVTAVRTPDGEYACDQLVLAAGPWTRPLASKLGVQVPTTPMRGQMLAFGRMVTPIGRPIWGARGYVLPRENGLVFAGSTVEDVGFRIRTTKRGLASVRRSAFELVPQLRHAREHFSWAGLRPGSPDGLPIMGPVPGWENVTVATGHFRNGILLGPITGQLIAEAIVTGQPSEALAPFSPARFSNS